MGAFDDLIARPPQSGATAGIAGGAFDDLVPRRGATGSWGGTTGAWQPDTRDNFNRGFFKAGTDAALGVRQIVGAAAPDEAASVRARDSDVMGTTAGKVGNFLGNVGLALPLTVIPGGQGLAGAALGGATLGAVQPTVEGESRLRNAAFGAAAGAAGQGAVNLVGRSLSNRAAGRAAAQVANAQRDSAAGAARQAGYTLPPTTTNPSFTNRMAEGFAGKLSTGQRASQLNQRVTNELVRRELGLAADAPLNHATLEGVRRAAGSVYEQVKSAGTLQVDDAYRAAVQGLRQENAVLAQEFPELASQKLDDLVTGLANKESFSSTGAVEAIRRLRDQAKNAFRDTSPDGQMLGRAARGAADAIEDLLERNLAAQGRGDLLTQFRSARELIAKTHSVESALVDEAGTVAAQKLGTQLGKGRPLTGGIRQAAEFGRNFPKAAQAIRESVPGISPLDYMAAGVGGVGGALTGNPLLAIAPLLRPAVRSGILSTPYQAFMGAPSYAAPVSGALGPLLQAPLTTRLAGLLGGVGAAAPGALGLSGASNGL